MGNWLVGDEQLKAARSVIARGGYLDEKELKKYEGKDGTAGKKGMLYACGKGTRGWNDSIERQKGRAWGEEESGEYFSQPG